MVIDWGFTQRAPFYIDLVDFFTRQESLLYWEALRRQGSALSQASFLERWQAASVYPGFIYLYPRADAVPAWGRFPPGKAHKPAAGRLTYR